MKTTRKAAFFAAILIGFMALGTTAHAVLPVTSVTVSQCLAAKIKTLGKGTASYTGCYSKAAAKPPLDPDCLSKTASKIIGAFAKAETKGDCTPALGDGTARNADAADVAVEVDGDVGSLIGKCDAAKQKCVGKYIAAAMGCYGKAAAKAATVDSNCLAKAATKLNDSAKGCLVKATFKGDCTVPNSQLPALQDAADLFMTKQTCLLDPANPGCPCGNGVSDVGEPCDASAPPATWNSCGPDFTCTDCNCACPTKMHFAADASDPETVLDLGWTGQAHRTPVVSNADLTLQVSGCTLAPDRPCGTCSVSGPVENPDANAGQLDNQRCTSDTSVHCSNAPGGTGGPCTGLGTCEFYLGSTQPLAAGGISTCVVNQLAGSISGTVNVETGSSALASALIARVYNGLSIDNPCPRCSDAGGINDGIHGGTCTGGPRNGMSCDANGVVPGRPDFGRTSLDCPPAGIIGTSLVDASSTTQTYTKTLSASSPSCTALGATGEKCLCDTCNNINAEPCDNNADCPPNGGPGICGGRRCMGGTNNGAPCTVTSQCPGGACARPGAATKPSACIDDTLTPTTGVLDCADMGNGEGQCTQGPVETTCSFGSGHAQRTCITDADCGGGVGSCEATNRLCFLTGGFSGENGTNTLIANGMADPPVGDLSNPTMGAVFCIAPTTSSAVNAVHGRPGPARETRKGPMTFHP